MNFSESKITQVFVGDEYEAAGSVATAGACTYVNQANTLSLERYDGTALQPIITIPKGDIKKAVYAAGVPLRTLKRYSIAFTSGVSVVTGTAYSLQLEIHNLFGFTKPQKTQVTYVAKSNDTTSTVLQKIMGLADNLFKDQDLWFYNAATVDTANNRIDEVITPFYVGKTDEYGAFIKVVPLPTAAGIDWATVTPSALGTTVPNGRKIANMEWAYQSQRQLTTYGTLDPRMDMNHDLLYASATKTYDIITITVRSEDRNGTPSEYDVVVASDHAATVNFASELNNLLNP